ncbi:MAG: hypothetical protein ACJ768_05955 [Gaiellaceae bacterium]
MTRSDQIIAAVVADNGGDPYAGIQVERLQELTAGQYEWAGANAGLFGSRHPRMESRGDLRFLTDYGRQKLVGYLQGSPN